MDFLDYEEKRGRNLQKVSPEATQESQSLQQFDRVSIKISVQQSLVGLYVRKPNVNFIVFN